MKLVCLVLAALLAAAPASAQNGAPAATGGSTVNLQGGDPRAFVDNRYKHAFYDLSKSTLGKGVEGVDIAAYEQKSFAIFHDFGESMGAGGGAHMVDHLKLIPRQIVGIVMDDPHALDSFDTFTDALVGPK